MLRHTNSNPLCQRLSFYSTGRRGRNQVHKSIKWVKVALPHPCWWWMEVHVPDMSLKMQKKKKVLQTRKKNRKVIKSPVLSIKRQFLIFNIYINCLSCVDDNFSWGTRGGRGRVTLADSTASFELCLAPSCSCGSDDKWHTVRMRRTMIRHLLQGACGHANKTNSCCPRSLPWPLPLWYYYCLLLQP